MIKLLVVVCFCLGLIGCTTGEKELEITNSNNTIDKVEEKTIDYIEFKDLGRVDISELCDEIDSHQMEYLSVGDGYIYFQDTDCQNETTIALYQLEIASGEIEEISSNLPKNAYISDYLVNFGKEFMTYIYSDSEDNKQQALMIDGESMIECDGTIILTDHGESFVVVEDDGSKGYDKKISWYNNEFEKVGITYSNGIDEVFCTGTYFGYTDGSSIRYCDGVEIMFFVNEEAGFNEYGHYNIMNDYIVFDVEENGEIKNTQLIDMNSKEVYDSDNISYGNNLGYKYQYYLINENEIGVECIQEENIVFVTVDGVQIDDIYNTIGYLSDTEIILTQASTQDEFLIAEIIVHEK